MSGYFYYRDGVQRGPIPAAELRALADRGGLSPEDLVWTEGMRQWQPAGTVAELFPAEAAAIPEASVQPTTISRAVALRC